MRAIFCLRAKPSLHGFRIREFVYDPVRDLHVWQGRELEVEEFNARSHEVMTVNEDLHPFVLLVAGVPPEVAAELERLRVENKTLRSSLHTRRPPTLRKEAE